MSWFICSNRNPEAVSKVVLARQLLVTCFSVLALVLPASAVYAEHTAPVYDVDSLSSDNQALNPDSSVEDHSKAALNQVLTLSNEPPASLDQKVERLEQQFSNLKQSDLSNRLNGIQGELQALRGQVEELTHQLQDLRQQRTESRAGQNKPLAEQTMTSLPRVNDEETAPSVSKGKSAAKQTALKQAANESAAKKMNSFAEQPNTAEEQAVYQTAYNLIKVKKYTEAIAALQKMLDKYPSGQSAANAHYWLGELYSLTGNHERAASEFAIVVKDYPSNPRVADAELKLGLINATLLKWPAAKGYFKTVISQYPGTTSARLAMEQLKLLKQSGH